MSALTKRVEQLERQRPTETVPIYLWGPLTEAEVAAAVAGHGSKTGVHPGRIKPTVIQWLSNEDCVS